MFEVVHTKLFILHCQWLSIIEHKIITIKITVSFWMHKFVWIFKHYIIKSIGVLNVGHMEKCKWVYFLRFFLDVDFVTLCKCNPLSPTYAKVFLLYKCLLSSFLNTLPHLDINMSLFSEKHLQKKMMSKNYH